MSIRQSNHDVGKVTPVTATSCGYVGYSSLNKWNHDLADVISQYRLTLVPPPDFYKNNIKAIEEKKASYRKYLQNKTVDYYIEYKRH